MAKNTFNLFKNIIDDKYINFNGNNDSEEESFEPMLVQIGHLTQFSSCSITYHKHDFLEVAFCVNGKFTAIINGKNYVLQKGEIAIYNADTNHMEMQYKNHAAEIYFLSIDNVFFQNHGKNYIIDPAESPIVNAGSLFPQLNMHLMELLIETNTKNILHKEYLENLTKLILITILRLLKKETNVILENNSVQEIIKYINEHYDEEIDLESLSDQAAYSKFYFSRLFKEHTGLSPIKYLQTKRLEKSKKLLEETELSIVDIAQTVGFQSMTYYCQLFKKFYKTTPSTYRNEYKETTD